jgi:hypothetical protein
MNKEALLQHCAACADHHLQTAKAHKSAAAATDGPAMEFHKSMAEIHTGHAEHYVKCFKAIEGGETAIDTNDDSEGTHLKVAGNNFGMSAARDFSKIKPDGVHQALPSMPTLVPRPGQAPFQKEKIESDTEAIDALLK